MRKIIGFWCWLELDCCHVRAPLRVGLTESSEGNSSSGRDASSLYKEGKAACDTGWYEPWHEADCLGCWGRAQKEPDWKVCGKVTWGRGMMMNLLLWAQSLCIFVLLSYIHAHQRTPPAEEALHNDVRTMSVLVDVE